MAFDLRIFNKQTYLAMTETIDQEINLFNAASGGVIELVNKPFEGNFSIEASFKAIAGLVRRRNAHGTGTVAAGRLEQILAVAVKVAAGTKPIEYERQQYEWIQQNPELAALTIGEQLAKARLADMLNAGIACAVTAIGKQADTKYTAPSSVNFTDLVKGAAKFGDRSAAVRAWVMHSGAQTDLYVNALTNLERLFSYDSVTVQRDPAGRLLIQTDCADLVGSAENYLILGLVDSGIVINGNDDFNAELVPTVGIENIKYTYQAEWSFGVAIKGYAWDTTKPASPTDAQLKTAANWLRTASSHKDTAGVLITTTKPAVVPAG